MFLFLVLFKFFNALSTRQIDKATSYSSLHACVAVHINMEPNVPLDHLLEQTSWQCIITILSIFCSTSGYCFVNNFKLLWALHLNTESKCRYQKASLASLHFLVCQFFCVATITFLAAFCSNFFQCHSCSSSWKFDQLTLQSNISQSTLSAQFS